MQRPVGSRGTRVLMFGLNSEEWLTERGGLKGELQSAHMGWSLSTVASLTAEKAAVYIKAHDDLEIVTMCGDSLLRPHDEMLREAALLAKTLGEHPHKPWVHFSGLELGYLEPVFRAEGLKVVYGMLGYIVFERWNSQIPERKAA